ncbi:hypothetical protein Hanom_Chr17g01552171 [Helianthus anomalus]
MISLRKDQEIENGGFGLAIYESCTRMISITIFYVMMRLSICRREMMKPYLFVLMGLIEDCVSSVVELCGEAESLNCKLDGAIDQLATRYPNSKVILPILERYKVIFNKCDVFEKCASKGLKTGKSGDDVNNEGDLFSTLHVTSTFTQNAMTYSDVILDVVSGAYDTLKTNDTPSFNLGLSQDLPST